MDYNEAEDAVRVIQRLNQYAERLCQRLQDARAWAALWKRAAKTYERLYRQGYDDAVARLLIENRELQAENERLQDALKAVEWVRDEDLPEYDEWCPWCGNYRRYGHVSNCPRQAALEDNHD